MPTFPCFPSQANALLQLKIYREGRLSVPDTWKTVVMKFDVRFTEAKLGDKKFLPAKIIGYKGYWFHVAVLLL